MKIYWVFFCIKTSLTQGGYIPGSAAFLPVWVAAAKNLLSQCRGPWEGGRGWELKHISNDFFFPIINTEEKSFQNQVQIRLYWSFFDWFGTKQNLVWFQNNRKMVNIIYDSRGVKVSLTQNVSLLTQLLKFLKFC